jgi:hypothetical protein
VKGRPSGKHSDVVAPGRITTALRVCALVAAATVFLVVFVGSVKATTQVYWGYNNLTASNPPAGTCPTWPSGFACSGWGNWDYSQVDWTSGSGTFAFGFICQSDGLFYGYVHGDGDTKTTYSVFYARLCPGHYNKAVSHLDGTYDYLQASALVF